MGAKQDVKKGCYEVIATKVSHEDRIKLKQIAGAFKMSFYELQQSLLLFILASADKGSTISDEHRTMVDAFFSLVASTTKDSFNPISMRERKSQMVSSAIVFMKRKEKQIPQTMMVYLNQKGKVMESYNQDAMLTTYLNSCYPELLRILTHEKKLRGCMNISQTLRQVIKDGRTADKDMIGEEVREMFSDNWRSEQGGRTIEYGERARRKKHYEIDGAGAQRIMSYSEEEDDDDIMDE